MRSVLLLVLLSFGLWADVLFEQVERIVGVERYTSHQRLVSLLFEREEEYKKGERYDLAKICRTLRENGLLPPSEKIGEVAIDYGDISPIFVAKLTKEVLGAVGSTRFLTREAVRDEKGFRWTLRMDDGAPDPVALIRRFEKLGGRVLDLALENGGWHYRVDLSDARLDTTVLKAGERRKILRPLRPVWVGVSTLRSLAVAELPGSHWYPDVTVYDKMLNILSVHRSDERRGYLRLRLPEGACYVSIGDRFTIDNLRSGLKLIAGGAR